MSLFSKRNFLARSSSDAMSQPDRIAPDQIRTSGLALDEKEECEDIWLSNFDEQSISSEDSSGSILYHIRQRQMTHEQPWTKDEIVFALTKLPAGEQAYPILSSLHGEALRKTLDDLAEIKSDQTSKEPAFISTVLNGLDSRKNSLVPEGCFPSMTQTALQFLNNFPDTCLLIACFLGNFEIVRALLGRHGNVAAKDADGRTPLHLAACAASSKILEELLRYGAKPCDWDLSRTCTALHCAAAMSDINCVKCLIKAGADVNAGLAGKSPLHYAVLNTAADCVEALLEAGASPNNPQVYTETPLHVAASLGSISCTKLLLSYGADVRVQFGSTRSTPLHLAAEEGSVECTRLLLEAGAGREARNSRGQAALHLAALSQSSETLEVLINSGARVNVEDDDGRTPLHAAVAKATRGIELVKILLQVRPNHFAKEDPYQRRALKNFFSHKAGATINKADKFGYTPLHIAALNESSQTVMMLLSKGADVTARTKGGISALSFLVRRTPDVLPRFVAYLDQAISLHDHELGDVDCELRIDFRPLVPGGRGETELMLCLVEVGQRHILKHPLCESFLYLKWLRIRKFFLLSLIFHSIFVAVFTAYIVVTYLWSMDRLKNILFWPVLIFTVVLACKELFQLVHGVCFYVRRWENWLQWSVVAVSAIVLLGPKQDWQHHAAALGVLLIWIELMMVVGRFPMFGLYIQMFTQVSLNFFKFLAAYLCLIVGFSLGFSVLHRKYKSFKNPLVGLLKTIIMMSGELEFEDVFFDKDTPVLYPGTAHLMLLSFVILVTVILTNLMVGLAVSDIQELRRCAGLDRLIRRAELVAYLESMLFSKFLDYAPTKLMKACRKGALLLNPPHHCALHIRPNDPREKRLPRELIRGVYRLISERKTRSTIARSTYYRLSSITEGDRIRSSRLYSTNSTSETNQRQFTELAAELKRCFYNINTQLDNLSNKVEAIARDIDTSMRL